MNFRELGHTVYSSLLGPHKPVSTLSKVEPNPSNTLMSRRRFLGLMARGAGVAAAATLLNYISANAEEIFLPYVANETEWSKQRDDFIVSSKALLKEAVGKDVEIEVDNSLESFSKDERARIFAGLYLGWQQQSYAFNSLRQLQPDTDWGTHSPLRVSDTIKIQLGLDGVIGNTEHEKLDDGKTKTTVSFGKWLIDSNNNNDSGYRALAAIHESVHTTEGYDIDDKIIESGYDFSVARNVREAHATIVTAQILKYMQERPDMYAIDPKTKAALDALEWLNYEMDFVGSANHRVYAGDTAPIVWYSGKGGAGSAEWQCHESGHLRMHLQARMARDVGSFENIGLVADALAHRAQIVYGAPEPAHAELVRTKNAFATLVSSNILPGKNYKPPSEAVEVVTVAPDIEVTANGKSAVMIEHLTHTQNGDSLKGTLVTPIRAELTHGGNTYKSATISANHEAGNTFTRWEAVFDEVTSLDPGDVVKLFDASGDTIYTLTSA